MRRLLMSSHGGLLVLVGLIVLVPLLSGSGFHLRLAALVWVYGLAAVGLNVLMGEAGQVSLGHAAFMGIGSYTVAIGPAHLGLDPLACAALATALSCLVAFAIGRPVLRLKGHYLSLGTLGFGYLVALVIVSEPALTGGPDGMPVPRVVLFGTRLAGASVWYWITAAFLLAGTLLALNLKASPSGRAFRALHDSEVAAGVLGIDVAGRKLAAFVIAAGYASLAGSLLALMNGFAAPATAGFLQSVELVTMVVVGGIGSVFGAIVGAAFMVLLPQVLTVFEDYETGLIGLTIILFMIFMRHGIVPGLRRALEPAR
ncbi:branched-chain amino acid ABC transporter permease [Azospirillum sp. ST 5-10]|uniref:branched-chain amino acid ABC transporter permease n=1 Tax=unclassified Azospirillum TaxID=2630922 RepID=UPI003F4A2D4E